MKKYALVAATLLCCFSLAASVHAAPATSEPSRIVTLEEIFSPAAGPVAPVNLAACEISKECVCGGGYVTIECSGNVSCTSGVRWVECDGVRTNCPPIGSCPP